MNDQFTPAETAAQFILSRTKLHPRIGLVLGSGLGAFADSLTDATRIPYAEIPSFPQSSAIGHAGRMVIGKSGHVAVDVQVPGEGAAVIANVGLGGLLGWSWLTPAHKWAFGAICVTEVRAYEFSVPAVRERCAADPALGDELTRRLFQVLAGRLQDTRAALITRGEDASRYATS